MSDSVWRAVFLASAIFNWLVGASMLFDASGPAAVGIEVVRFDAFYSPVTGWFVILFGLLYFAVWRDLENRAIVFIGMLGKLGIVAIVWIAWLRGLVPTSMAAITVVDLVFAALFAMFLITRQPAGARS